MNIYAFSKTTKTSRIYGISSFAVCFVFSLYLMCLLYIFCFYKDFITLFTFLILLLYFHHFCFGISCHVLHICCTFVHWPVATPLWPTDVLYACRQKNLFDKKRFEKDKSEEKTVHIGNLLFNFRRTNHLQGEVGR